MSQWSNCKHNSSLLPQTQAASSQGRLPNVWKNNKRLRYLRSSRTRGNQTKQTVYFCLRYFSGPPSSYLSTFQPGSYLPSPPYWEEGIEVQRGSVTCTQEGWWSMDSRVSSCNHWTSFPLFWDLSTTPIELLSKPSSQHACWGSQASLIFLSHENCGHQQRV